MRKWFASLGALGLAVSASAQTIPCADALKQTGYDNGQGSTGWKVAAPTGSGDRMSTDFNADLNGQKIIGMGVDHWVTSGSAGSLILDWEPSNLALDATGNTPDDSVSLSGGKLSVVAPAQSNAFCPAVIGWDTTDFTAGTDVHASVTMNTGDSNTWLCSDTGAPAGRAYFTTNAYSTTAIPFTLNWMIRGLSKPSAGSFAINGGTSATVRRGSGSVQFDFWGVPGNPPSGKTLYLQMLKIGALQIPAPRFVLSTGFFCTAFPDFGRIGGSLSCSAPLITGINFFAFYLDKIDTKPNGKGKIKTTNTVTMDIGESKVCNPLICYGQTDDGVFDATGWKVNYPSSSGDWMTNRIGPKPAGTTNATQYDLVTWDTAGSGGSYQENGLYADNGSAIGNVPVDTVAGLSVAASTFATTYSGAISAPLTAAFPSGVDLWVGTRWNGGDSNLWMMSDTDGTDDDTAADCGSLPNTSAFFTPDNYASGNFAFSGANWMQRILHN